MDTGQTDGDLKEELRVAFAAALSRGAGDFCVLMQSVATENNLSLSLTLDWVPGREVPYSKWTLGGPAL